MYAVLFHQCQPLYYSLKSIHCTIHQESLKTEEISTGFWRQQLPYIFDISVPIVLLTWRNHRGIVTCRKDDFDFTISHSLFIKGINTISQKHHLYNGTWHKGWCHRCFLLYKSLLFNICIIIKMDQFDKIRNVVISSRSQYLSDKITSTTICCE